MTIAIACPSSRAVRYSNARRLARSAHCASSTASRTGWKPAASQCSPCRIENGASTAAGAPAVEPQRGGGEHGRVREQLRPPVRGCAQQLALEELADEAERVGLLVLARTGGEHRHAAFARGATGGFELGGAADAGRPFEQHERAFAAERAVQRRRVAARALRLARSPRARPIITCGAVLLERGAEETALADALTRVESGSGALVVLEAAGGLGKTSLLRGAQAHARRTAASGSCTRAGPSSSPGFPFGVVRQLLRAGAPPGRAGRAGALALGRRRRSRGRCSSRTASSDDRGRRRRRLPAPARAVLADGEPVRRLPAPARRRRRAVGGRAVAAVPRLPRAADRGHAGAACSSPPGRSTRTPGPRCTQLVADPASEVLRPRPLSGEAVGRLLAARIGAEADAAFVRACRERDAGQPAAAERARARGDRAGHRADGRRGRAGRGARAAGHRHAWCCPASRACRPRPARSRGRSPSSATAPSLRAAAELAGLEDAVPALRTLLARRGRRRRRWARLRAPDRPRRGLREHRRTAPRCTGARPASWPRPATPDEAVGAQLLAAHPARRPVGRRARCGRRPQRALGLGDPRGRGHVSAPRAGGAARRRRAGRACCSSSGGPRRAPATRRRSRTSSGSWPRRPTRGWPRRRRSSWRPCSSSRARRCARWTVTERALERLGDADPELAERLEVEQFGSAYISIARPHAARRRASPRSSDPPHVPTTLFDRFHLAGMRVRRLRRGPPRRRGGGSGHARARRTARWPPTRPRAATRSSPARSRSCSRSATTRPTALYSGALEDARRRGSGIAFATASSLRSLVAFRRGRLSEALADASRRAGAGRRVHGSQGFLAAALGTLVYTALDQGTVDADLEAFAERFVREQAADYAPLQPRHARPRLPARAPRRAGAGATRSCWPPAGASWSGARATRPSRPGARPPPSSPHELGDVRAARRAGVRGGGAGAGVRRPARARHRAAGRGARGRTRAGDRAAGRGGRRAGAARSARSSTPARLIDHGLLLAAVGAERSLAAPRLTAGHALAIRCGAAALAGPRRA